MNTKIIGAPLVVLLVLLSILIGGSVYTVHETQRALVFQFGELVRSVEEPGLKFKLPFVQNVLFYDKRLLSYNLPILEVNARDQKRLVVDLYARYEISDTLQFYRKVGDIRGVENRLSGLVLDIMQEVIGRIPLSDMLSVKRAKIMEEIHQKVKEKSGEFGISVRDVRIIRADLPRENSEAIFTRMKSERNQEAKQFRAEGDEKGKEIRAQAEKEKTLILADAKKISQELRGQGDALAYKIFNDAVNQDRKFYEIYRTYEAYANAMQAEDTTYILTPDSRFMKHFNPVAK